MISPEHLLIAPERLPRRWKFDWSALTGEQRRSLFTDLPPMTFATSGTTGRPVGWTRSAEQLVKEVEATLRCLPAEINYVLSTASPASLYGYVGSVLIPMRLGVPVVSEPSWLRGWTFATGRTLVITVAPSWRTGCTTPKVNSGASVTFVHSGSVVGPRPARLVGRLADAELVDLFGATEVGLIGRRLHTENTRVYTWDIADDVHLTADTADSRLVVRSPRIATREHEHAAPDHLVLEDVGTIVGHRRFTFGGRLRLGKPGGRSVDLVALEELLWDLAPPGADLACVPAMADHGEVVEVHLATDDSGVELFRHAIQGAASRLPVMPNIVRVPTVDRSAMGKPRHPYSDLDARPSNGGTA